jgi:oxygen-independent coproporphyrinogen-3 oxidase
VDIVEETSHILALGAGGISKRIYPEEGHIGRAPNVSHIETYIGRLDEMIRRKRELFLDESEGKGAARSPEDARDGIQ